MDRIKKVFGIFCKSGILSLLLYGTLWAQGSMPASAAPSLKESLGFIGAALSTGLAAIGAGVAIAYVGSAAAAGISEKPENFGKMIIFLGLAEGIAIYGLITSILILNKM